MRDAAVLALFAASCGPDPYVLLQVSGDFAVPEQVNSVEIRTVAYTGGADLGHVEVALHDGDTFPVDVLLEPREQTPDELEVRAVARLDGVAVADGVAILVWQKEKVVRVKLPLLPR